MGRPSKQQLDTVFGTHKDDDVVIQILEKGQMQAASEFRLQAHEISDGDTSHRDLFGNSFRRRRDFRREGGGQQHSWQGGRKPTSKRFLRSLPLTRPFNPWSLSFWSSLVSAFKLLEVSPSGRAFLSSHSLSPLYSRSSQGRILHHQQLKAWRKPSLRWCQSWRSLSFNRFLKKVLTFVFDLQSAFLCSRRKS